MRADHDGFCRFYGPDYKQPTTGGGWKTILEKTASHEKILSLTKASNAEDRRPVSVDMMTKEFMTTGVVFCAPWEEMASVRGRKRKQKVMIWYAIMFTKMTGRGGKRKYSFVCLEDDTLLADTAMTLDDIKAGKLHAIHTSYMPCMRMGGAE